MAILWQLVELPYSIFFIIMLWKLVGCMMVLHFFMGLFVAKIIKIL